MVIRQTAESLAEQELVSQAYVTLIGNLPIAYSTIGNRITVNSRAPNFSPRI